MPVSIREYAQEHVEAVRQFNERLRVGGAVRFFPLSAVPRWLPKLPGRRLFQEQYLVVDETGAVRGAYMLKYQNFQIHNQVVTIGDVELPVSEGAVNRRYPQVGVHLIRDAMERQPLLYGLGIGSYDDPLTRLLEAAGWSTTSVPFFFRVVKPFAFLRNIAHLRQRPLRRLALDVLALTGLGWLGIHGLQAVCRPAAPANPAVAVEQVDEFTGWVDALWESCKAPYGMSAVRDAETLRILYSREDPRFIRLRVFEGARILGWAVVLDTPWSGHNHFGNMRVGSIVDCFAAPADAAAVINAARDVLLRRRVDLILTNQSHAAWCAALDAAGFLRGPSNFIFASSPKLTEMLQAAGFELDDLHINRGDGDGPINL